MKYKNTHPYTILGYLYKFATLLIFPILQQLIFKPHTLKDIFINFGKNILLIGIIFVWAFLKYKSVKYGFYKDKIFIKTGLLVKKTIVIPVDKISSVHVVEKISSSFFDCYKTYINIPIAKSKKESISLNFSREELNMLKSFILNIKDFNIVYKADKSRVTLMALFWSNPVTSFILTAPFVYRFSRILGEDLSQKIYSTIDIRLTLIALGLPPFFASIAYILFGTFLTAFLIQFFRYSRFETYADSENILIKRGLIRSDKKIIKKEKALLVSIKQTVLMKLLKLYNAYVTVVSESTKKESESLVLIAVERKELIKALEENIPIEIFNRTDIKPKSSLLKNFLAFPVLCLLGMIIFICKTEKENLFSQTVALFLRLVILFLLWWILFRVQAHRHSGVAVNNGVLNLRGFKKLTLFSEFIPIENITQLQLSQSMFQKFSNRCNLKIFVAVSSQKSFSCKHLSLNDVENLVEKVKNHKN